MCQCIFLANFNCVKFDVDQHFEYCKIENSRIIMCKHKYIKIDICLKRLNSHCYNFTYFD